MKTLFVSETNFLRKLVAMTGLLLTSAISSHAGSWTAYYLNASSYSCAEGGSISGTVYREAYNETSGSDWNIAAAATAVLYISGSGTYQIGSSDVTSSGSYSVTIPAYSYSASFTINFNNNTNLE